MYINNEIVEFLKKTIISLFRYITILPYYMHERHGKHLKKIPPQFKDRKKNVPILRTQSLERILQLRGPFRQFKNKFVCTGPI